MMNLQQVQHAWNSMQAQLDQNGRGRYSFHTDLNTIPPKFKKWMKLGEKIEIQDISEKFPQNEYLQCHDNSLRFIDLFGGELVECWGISENKADVYLQRHFVVKIDGKYVDTTPKIHKVDYFLAERKIPVSNTQISAIAYEKAVEEVDFVDSKGVTLQTIKIYNEKKINKKRKKKPKTFGKRK